MSDKPKGGGSYVVTKDGGLERVSHTAPAQPNPAPPRKSAAKPAPKPTKKES